MTFSCYVFRSILLGHFSWSFGDLLALRVPMGLQMGLFGEPWGAKLAHNYGLWWHHGSKVAPRLQKGAIWVHFGVSFWGILECYLYDFYVKYKVFFSRLSWIQVIFSDQGLFHLYRFFICFSCVYPYSVDVVEAAPPGAAQDHWSCWDMQTWDHHSCCICVCPSCQCKSCGAFLSKRL